MSRLWIQHKSDIDNKPTGHGASEVARAQINYGSAKDSRLAVKVCVVWNKGEDFPTVSIEAGQGVKTEITKP